MDFPKDYRENLEARHKLLVKAKNDPEYRVMIKELFHRDVLFAFNMFFYTLDVRRRPEHHQPFCTYPFQDRAILDLKQSIRAGEDIVFEKSRDMGCSWLVIGTFLHEWLDPAGGADFLLGSRIEDYVDKKGDMRTLMQKARYALYRLPRWLWPKGFKRNKHDNFMRLQNPETGATITGESNNANFSTGGRYLAVLFDEFAKWESTDKSAWTAAGDATPCRVAVSTPFGAGGQYYELVTGGQTRVITLHWSLHPLKAEGSYCVWPLSADDKDRDERRLVRSPWYDRQCARRSPTEIAQELDIDYIGAGNPVFDGKAGKRVAHLLRHPREPVGYWEVDFAVGGLRPVSKPRDWEAYVVAFEKKDEDALYLLGVDVVEGVEGGDFAVVKVLNRRTESCAASYYARIDEVRLALVVDCVAKMWTTYESPWVAIETNGPGLATFDLCATVHQTEGLFMMPRFDQATGQLTVKKGWRTDTTSRNKLIAVTKEWLLRGEGWVDTRCLREMTTFVRTKTGKPEAKEGTHDDEVLAWGIALTASEYVPNEERVEEPKVDERGVPENAFDREAHPVEEPKTLEERCYESLMRKREDALVAFLEDEDLAHQMVARNWGR